MRRPAAALLCLLCLLTCAPARSSAAQACLVARVTTEKGALKLRSSAQGSSRVLEKIPCGTCILVTGESGDWCQAVYHQQTGFCKRSFLTFLPDADPALLNYRILRQGDRGEDVLQVKRRLQELGYIRQGSSLTDVYNPGRPRSGSPSSRGRRDSPKPASPPRSSSCCFFQVPRRCAPTPCQRSAPEAGPLPPGTPRDASCADAVTARAAAAADIRDGSPIDSEGSRKLLTWPPSPACGYQSTCCVTPVSRCITFDE